MSGRFLVTGGAGYVGSHCVATLLDRGHQVVVIDDLSRGHREAVLEGAVLIEGRCGDPATLARAFALGPFDAVLHFAAHSLVGESMAEPFPYFRDNVGEGIALLEAALAAGVRRFVLSSTANLFGAPAEMPITEDTPLAPASPYGESKFFFERILAWADRIFGLRYATLRYFNAAGADPAGRLGEDHDPETHLIPLALDAALGRRPPLTIFGTDYPTPDGTCIRDYIHVSDLATAHLAALEAIARGSRAYNLGTGHGYSVREVIAAVERVTGRRVPVIEGARRAGDPPVLVASSARIQAETGWQPRFTTLDEIIATAHAWRLAHPDGYR